LIGLPPEGARVRGSVVYAGRDLMGFSEREWERGWEGHDRAQRQRIARLSLIEKLEWLESAQRVLRHLRSQGHPKS